MNTPPLPPDRRVRPCVGCCEHALALLAQDKHDDAQALTDAWLAKHEGRGQMELPIKGDK